MALSAVPPGFYERNIQDVGGQKGEDRFAALGQPSEDALETPLSGFIKNADKPLKYWEFQMHALLSLLAGAGLATAGEVRRGIEVLPPESFAKKTYYEKWAAATAAISLERGTITQAELDAALGNAHATAEVLYKPGDYVRVKVEDASVRFRKPHLRTPGYLFGIIGRIDEPGIGLVEDPDNDAFHYIKAPPQPTYRVYFWQHDLWCGYQGKDDDRLQIEIWQSWLEPATKAEFERQQKTRVKLDTGSHGHHEDHAHSHDHGDHSHEARADVEQKAVDAEADDAERSRLTKALVKVFTEKGLVKPADMTAVIQELEGYGQRLIGPRIVARAWTDPGFKSRLLEDGASAVAELDISAGAFAPGAGKLEPNAVLAGLILKVVEDTPEVYHLLVCTLCSCYPISILGTAPSWYKARAYRARSVRDPRSVLKEFGTHVPEDVTIQICDSNADTRFIKLPLRPAGTEGWSEEQLQALVTRDSMVGVAYCKSAEQVKRDGSFKSNAEPFKGLLIAQ